MMSRSHCALLGLMSITAGCQRADPGSPGAPEIHIVVNADRVEVLAQQPGSCRVVGDLPEPGGCQSITWENRGIASLFEPVECVPAPTCVSGIRLERAGQAIASAEGRSAVFATELGGGERVVVTGCGEPLNIDLPPPLAGVDLQLAAESDEIHITATGTGVQSTLGRATSLPSLFNGYSVSCRGDAAQLTLPASADYDVYVVESFALGEPLLLEGGSVRVYPASRRREALSKSLPLGPIWQATVAAAKLSPLYSECDGYCAAWQEACLPTASRDQCSVLCVAEGTLRPSCAESWAAHLRCAQAAPNCDPSTAQDGASPACAAEAAAYEQCTGASSSEGD